MTAEETPNKRGSQRPPAGSAPPGVSRQMLVLLVLMLGLMWFWKSNSEEGAQPAIAYSQLYKWIEEGKVVSVVLDGDFVDATLKSPEALDGRQIRDLRTSAVANDPALLPLLHQKGVKITVKSQKQPFALQMLFTLLPWALIIGAWLWMSRRAQGMMGMGGPLSGLIKNRSRQFDKATSVNVTFEDIAGLKAAKSDLQEIVQFLKEPERFRRLGGKVPRGVLLAGPPGTGKTLLARACAICSARPRRALRPSCSSTRSTPWAAPAAPAWGAAMMSANRR